MHKEKGYRFIEIIQVRLGVYTTYRLFILISILVSLFILSLCNGCRSQKKKSTIPETEFKRITSLRRSGSSEKLIIEGQTITYDDVVKTMVEYDGNAVPLIERLKPIAQISSLEEFKKWARPQVKRSLMYLISDILLYQQAKRDAPEKVDEALEKMAEKELRKFIMSFDGDEAKADEALKQQGMNRKSFKDYQKRLILTQSYISEKLPDKKPITHSELVKYYNQMKDELFITPALLQFRLIDIQPAKIENAETQQNALDQARELAQQIIRRLNLGEDFGELAKQYSHGHRREFGGLWNPIQPESLAKPYDILAIEAEKIEPGQIAGPIETDGHIFIMKLERKRAKSYEALEKIQSQIEQKIILNRRREAISELNDKLIKQAAVGDTDWFIDSCLEKIYRQETGDRRQKIEK